MSFGVVALSTGKTEKYYANVYMRSSFGGGPPPAGCGDTTGTIKSLDTLQGYDHLEEPRLAPYLGSQRHEAFDFKVGEKRSRLSFTKAGDKMDATSYQACDLMHRHHYWRRLSASCRSRPAALRAARSRIDSFVRDRFDKTQ